MKYEKLKGIHPYELFTLVFACLVLVLLPIESILYYNRFLPLFILAEKDEAVNDRIEMPKTFGSKVLNQVFDVPLKM